MLFATLACGAIGFLDDFIKLTHRRSLGLSGRWKMLLLARRRGRSSSLVADHLQIEHDVFVPIVNVNLPLSYVWYLFLFLIIAGTANGTNLADGVDGLAAGTGIIALFTFTAMNVVSYVRSRHRPRAPQPDRSRSRDHRRRARSGPRSASSGTTRSPPR